MANDSPPAQASETLRPLRNLYNPLKFLLIAYIVAAGALSILELAEYRFRTAEGIDPFDEDADDLAWFGLLFVILALLYLVGFAGSVFLMCRWTFRAMKTVRLAGAPDATMSPGWAVGWYFIPVANLWKPFEGMLQIWRASRRLVGEPEKVAAYVGWWWAMWLLSNILTNLSLRLQGLIEDGPNYDAGLIVSAIAGLISVIAALLLLKTAGTITRAQDSFGRRSLAETFS